MTANNNIVNFIRHASSEFDTQNDTVTHVHAELVDRTFYQKEQYLHNLKSRELVDSTLNRLIKKTVDLSEIELEMSHGELVEGFIIGNGDWGQATVEDLQTIYQEFEYRTEMQVPEVLEEYKTFFQALLHDLYLKGYLNRRVEFSEMSNRYVVWYSLV